MSKAQSFSNDDTMLFISDEGDQQFFDEETKDWKIIIADDEDEVHKITRLVLDDYRFKNRGLKFLSAHTGAEAMKLIKDNPDTAIILLDVVMENDDTGLEVIKYIRDSLNNRFTRIILRTGQPGKAPEKNVIMEYDINAYKHKAELTAQNLFITITSSLRTYKDLMIIERSRKGLEHIINSSSSLFEFQSVYNFARGALLQLYGVLQVHIGTNVDGLIVSCKKDQRVILASTGKFGSAGKSVISAELPVEVIEAIEIARVEKKSFYADNIYVIYFNTHNGVDHIAYVSGLGELSELDKELINVFSINVSVAFDNFMLNQEVLDTQREVIFTLGEVVENHSRETANHVRRVSKMAGLLAQKLGLPESDVEEIEMAAPMHDVGKIGIPDIILKKPGKLTPEEYEVMKTHSEIGFGILKKSNRDLLKAAAIIAHEHHEKWNGTGYPNKLAGEEIHIYGRIIGLVDVFDALGHKRVYKDAWSIDRIIALLQSEKGQHFDPTLIELFLRDIEEFLDIGTQYPD
ncbi:MAG: DUF3369 domain-containing protein [Fibrobacterales bacterium]